MEHKRRRVRRNSGYNNLLPEEQVSHVIENWEEIWTPFNAEVEYGPTIDDLEYFDDYYLPKLLEEMQNTQFEKYKDEIAAEIARLFFNN